MTDFQSTAKENLAGLWMKQIFSKHSCLICSFILLGWNAVSVLVLWKTFLCCFLMEFKLLILLGYLIYQWYDFFQNNLKRQKWKHEICFSMIILKQNSYSLGLIFLSSMLPHTSHMLGTGVWAEPEGMGSQRIFGRFPSVLRGSGLLLTSHFVLSTFLSHISYQTWKSC